MMNLLGVVEVLAKNGTHKIRQAFQEAKRRVTICRSCTELVLGISQSLDHCNKCGCLVEAKTKIPGAHCPLSKW